MFKKIIFCFVFTGCHYLSDQLVISAAENASIRLWRFDEIRSSNKSTEK